MILATPYARSKTSDSTCSDDTDPQVELLVVHCVDLINSGNLREMNFGQRGMVVFLFTKIQWQNGRRKCWLIQSGASHSSAEDAGMSQLKLLVRDSHLWKYHDA